MKSLQILVFAACVVYAVSVSLYAQDFDDEWQAWKITHKKSYADEREEKKRRLIWQDNLEFIVKHNLEHQRGLHSYRLGMNGFGDMEHEEFNSMYSGFLASGYNRTGKAYLNPLNVEIPDAVDWRDKGYVTPVENQGFCGSCWAFSATGALEGQNFKKTGKLVSLSEQNLVDCVRRCHGCDGGWYTVAFEYVEDNGGIETEESYPYFEEDMICQFDPSNVGGTCSGHVDLPMANESALQEAVATIGPVSVAIDTKHESFRFYHSGVYYEPKCSSYRIDHAMLVVGYGISKYTSEQYWIVKNSWGSYWGQEGYIWLSRNKYNHCGIATVASYPLV